MLRGSLKVIPGSICNALEGICDPEDESDANSDIEGAQAFDEVGRYIKPYSCPKKS